MSYKALIFGAIQDRLLFVECWMGSVFLSLSVLTENLAYLFQADSLCVLPRPFHSPVNSRNRPSSAVVSTACISCLKRLCTFLGLQYCTLYAMVFRRSTDGYHCRSAENPLLTLAKPCTCEMARNH